MSSPPTAYVRQADFTGFSSAHPDEQQNGVDLDDEFNALKLTTDSLISRLGQVQRSDGLLTNQIVTPDSLSSDVLNFFVAMGSSPRGAWLTATAYLVRDLITQGGAVYICAIAHTSGVFATDLAAGKWQVLSNAAGNQALNTTSNVQFANLTLTGTAIFQSTLSVTGITTLTGYTKIGTAAAAANAEKLRVGGDVNLDGNISRLGLVRNAVVSWTNRTTDITTNLFWLANQPGGPAVACAAVRMRIWVFNTDVQSNYAVFYAEYHVKVRSSGGLEASSLVLIYQDSESVNASIINISGLAVSVSQHSGTEVIACAPSIVGSGGSTKWAVYAEAEAIGDQGVSLIAAPAP